MGTWTPSSSSGGGGSSAWSLINTTTIAGAAAPFDQSGIAGTFNDLLLVLIGRVSLAAANDDIMLQFNGDTAANYLWQMMEGTGVSSVAQSSSGATNFIRMGHLPGSSATANYFGHCEVILPGYASTTWNKIANILNIGTSSTGTTAQWAEHLQGQWNNTAAINRVTIKADDGGAGNFVIGSQLRIYGRT